MEQKLTEAQAARLVQAQLNSMGGAELGAVLAKSDDLRKNSDDPIARRVGELMYQQCLAAFTYKGGKDVGEMDGVL